MSRTADAASVLPHIHAESSRAVCQVRGYHIFCNILITSSAQLPFHIANNNAVNTQGMHRRHKPMCLAARLQRGSRAAATSACIKRMATAAEAPPAAERAALLVIGTEILSGSVTDTNTPWLARLLYRQAAHTIPVCVQFLQLCAGVDGFVVMTYCLQELRQHLGPKALHKDDV